MVLGTTILATALSVAPAVTLKKVKRRNRLHSERPKKNSVLRPKALCALDKGLKKKIPA